MSEDTRENKYLPIMCLDLEGVLVPEIWPFIAKMTGISELAVTTREEPDYLRLVNRRLDLLKMHNLKATSVVQMVESLEVMSGAIDFLNALKQRFDILIVSDAFKPMVNPFLKQLGGPKIECNHFVEDDHGFFSQAKFCRPFGKESTVKKLKAIGHPVIAIGDAFNDLGMLRAADLGILYKPSECTRAAASGIKEINTYEEILATQVSGFI